MTSQLMEKAVRGTYHITNRGECSWYQFAKKIIAFQGSQRKVHPVSASSLSLPAPASRLLGAGQLRSEIGGDESSSILGGGAG